MRILLLILIAIGLLPYAEAQDRFILPKPSLLVDSGVSRIDVYRQDLEKMDHWETRTVRTDEDTLKGDPKLVATFFINADGKTDSLIEFDGSRTSVWRLRYDELQQLTHMTSMVNGTLVNRWVINYYPDSIRVTKWDSIRWVHSHVTDSDTILLRSKYRNETDSGVNIYDPIDERKVSEMYREGRLAIRTEMDYLMKDGKPDSLYVKNDFFETAFETYWLASAPKHAEGWLKVYEGGGAIVPEFSPLFGTIETGYAFGDHRTQIRIVTFPKRHIFSEAALLRESPIWPTFHPDSSCDREFYIFRYSE